MPIYSLILTLAYLLSITSSSVPQKTNSPLSGLMLYLEITYSALKNKVYVSLTLLPQDLVQWLPSLTKVCWMNENYSRNTCSSRKALHQNRYLNCPCYNTNLSKSSTSPNHAWRSFLMNESNYCEWPNNYEDKHI